MSDCALPSRELRATEAGQTRIMLDRDVAWAWAGDTGRARVVGTHLESVEGIDTVGEAIVTISNSERQREDFGLVYNIIARANSAAVLSERVLAQMVESAEEMFGGPSPVSPRPGEA